MVVLRNKSFSTQDIEQKDNTTRNVALGTAALGVGAHLAGRNIAGREFGKFEQKYQAKHPNFNAKTASPDQFKQMMKTSGRYLGKNTAYKAGLAGSIGGAALTLGSLGVAYAAHKKNKSSDTPTV